MPLTQPTVGTIHSSLRIPAAAGPAVQLHLAIRRLRRQRRELRLVTVAVQIAQVGFGVLRMNMLPGPDSHERVADRLAIFDDVLALGDRAERKLVPARHRLRQRKGYACQLNCSPAARSRSATATLSCS